MTPLRTVETIRVPKRLPEGSSSRCRDGARADPTSAPASISRTMSGTASGLFEKSASTTIAMSRSGSETAGPPPDQAVEARTEPAVLRVPQELDRQEPLVLLDHLGGAVPGAVVEDDRQVVAADLPHDLSDLVEQETEGPLLLVGRDQKIDHETKIYRPSATLRRRLNAARTGASE